MGKDGEKARKVICEQLKGKEVVAELLTNTQCLVVSEDTVYLGSKRVFRHVYVNRFPISTISKVDVRKTFAYREMEIVTAGSVEPGSGVSVSKKIDSGNVLFMAGQQLTEAHRIADLILELKRKEAAEQQAPATDSIPHQIKQLAELREQGILSEQEFEEKKRELLSRM